MVAEKADGETPAKKPAPAGKIASPPAQTSKVPFPTLASQEPENLKSDSEDCLVVEPLPLNGESILLNTPIFKALVESIAMKLRADKQRRNVPSSVGSVEVTGEVAQVDSDDDEEEIVIDDDGEENMTARIAIVRAQLENVSAKVKNFRKSGNQRVFHQLQAKEKYYHNQLAKLIAKTEVNFIYKIFFKCLNFFSLGKHRGSWI